MEPHFIKGAKLERQSILLKNQRALHFSQDAANDYFSFRILFDRGLTLNSVQLASTAIEKLLKSFINALSDEAQEIKSHKISKIVQDYEILLDKHHLIPRKELIEWLEEIYCTRYSTDSYKVSSFDFSERHLLVDVKRFFDIGYSFLSSLNSKFGESYFNSPFEIYLQSLPDSQNLNKPLSMGPHRVCSLLFRGNYPIRVTADLKAYNPSNPYTRNGLQEDGDRLIFSLDFGEVSLMDICPDDLRK